MNEKEIIEVLGRLKGEADAPTHRAALRRALLAEPAGMPRFAALTQLITIRTMKRYYIPLAAIALVAVGAAAFNPGDPTVAQAQEQAQRAFTRAIEISPAMRAELEAKMKSDMLATLKEAMAAPDLKIMTKEEFQAQSPFSFSTTAAAPAIPLGAVKEFKTVSFTKGEAVAATKVGEIQGDVTFTVSASAVQQGGKAMTASAGVMTAGVAGEFSEPVKYLSYTDPRGNKTVLGLDKNDTPVFKLASLNASDVMHFEDGSVGIQGKAVQVMHVENGIQVSQ